MQRNQYKGFSKIDNLIRHTAKQYNLENAYHRHKALKAWQQLSGSFVEEAGEQTQAVDFKKGVLIIACLSKELANKLKLLAHRIISALNQVLGRQIVYAIYIQV